MARLIINNKGIATVLAISIMIFIASIAVAVIPNINNLLKQNSLSADMLKAQMAAETGAKRAIAELYQGKDGENYNWTWLGIDKHLTGNNGSLYNVSISGTSNLQGNTIPTSGKYTITAVGKYGEKSKTVKVDVEIEKRPDTFRFVAFSPEKINISLSTVSGDIMSKEGITFIENLSADGLYTPDKDNINNVTVVSVLPPLWVYIGEKKDSNDIFGSNLNSYPKILKLDSIFFDKAEKMNATKFLSLYQNLEPGKYEVDGNFTIIGGNAIDLSRQGNAIIHVKGDLTIGLWSRIGGFINNLFIDDGKNFLIIVDGDVTILGNSGLNNTTLISYGSVTIAGTTNLKGTIQARNGIVSSFITKLNYSSKAIAPFQQYASQINYGTDETFKVSNWR